MLQLHPGATGVHYVWAWCFSQLHIVLVCHKSPSCSGFGRITWSIWGDDHRCRTCYLSTLHTVFALPWGYSLALLSNHTMTPAWVVAIIRLQSPISILSKCVVVTEHLCCFETLVNPWLPRQMSNWDVRCWTWPELASMYGNRSTCNHILQSHLVQIYECSSGSSLWWQLPETVSVKHNERKDKMFNWCYISLLTSINILTGICQISLFHTNSVLLYRKLWRKSSLVFWCSLIWLCQWMTQPVGIDITYYCLH